MPGGKFKLGKTLVIAGGMVLLSPFAFTLIESSRPISRPPLPNPNGYDDFMKAQREMVVYDGDVIRATVEQLRGYLAKNGEALKFIRQGLAKECRIPVEFSTNYLFQRSLGDVKKLLWLLEADGRLAELEQRSNDATRIYLDAIRYGQESCRGGVMIDRLVGIACQASGMSWLQKVAGALDAKTCRKTAKQLQEIDRRREPVAVVLRNERKWIRRNFTFRQCVQAMIPIAALNPVKRTQKDFVKKCTQIELQLKRLMVEFATRAYELDHGQHPKSLNELVPDYLDAMPVDPTTGTNLTYLP